MIPLVFVMLFFGTHADYFSEDLQECVNSQRIIGGFCTSITDRPFQALLFFQDNPKCGASVISIRWILTAAHCVYGVPEHYIFVGVGSSKVDGLTMQYYIVDKVIVHENYVANETTVVNDIALLRTLEPIQLNSRVQPIFLSSVTPTEGDETIVSGYGVTNPNSFVPTSEFLMSVNGKVIDMNQCKALLGQVGPKLEISEGTICAGDLNGGKDSCRGDSGGPITIGNVLVGIVSWGIDCAEKMMPAFYMDVAYYLDWIMNTASKNSPVSTACHERRCDI